MTRRVIVGLVLSVVVVAGGCIDKQNNTDDARARTCADRLGIRWTVQDGATQRLDAFKACAR